MTGSGRAGWAVGSYDADEVVGAGPVCTPALPLFFLFPAALWGCLHGRVTPLQATICCVAWRGCSAYLERVRAVIPDDLDDIKGICEKVEAEANLRGWDNEPPMLFMVLDAGDEYAVMAPAPMQPAAFLPEGGGRASLGLEAMLAAMESPRWRQLLADKPAATYASLAALVFVCEAWSVIPEQRRQYPDRANADVPGGRELRMVIAVDCAGRLYGLCRWRGEEAKWADATPGQTVEGYVPVLLARMLKLLTEHAPAGSVDRRALNRVIREVRTSDGA